MYAVVNVKNDWVLWLFIYLPFWCCFRKKMGVYLSTPKTEKFSEDGRNENVRYGLSSMQGWRATMEDAVSTFCTISIYLNFASMGLNYMLESMRM